MTDLDGSRSSVVLDEDAAAGGPRPRTTTLLWWGATILTLVVLDDLTFGPAFWALSRLAGPVVASAAIVAIYVPAQVYLVHRATAEHPGRLASFLLSRYDLSRRHPRIREREFRLRQQVTGGASAVLSSLLIAGVLPPLLLWRAGFPVGFVRRLAWITALVYALEFAVLHGITPSLL